MSSTEVFDEIMDYIFVILHGEWLEEFAFGNTKLPHYQLLPTFVLYLGLEHKNQTNYRQLLINISNLFFDLF